MGGLSQGIDGGQVVTKVILGEGQGYLGWVATTAAGIAIHSVHLAVRCCGGTSHHCRNEAVRPLPECLRH